MISFLVDHNMEGQAVLLLKTLETEGWLDLVPLSFVTFDEVGLSVDSDDRTVWRCCQTNQMILLTDNRNMKGEDSLEQTLREENTTTSFPIVTVGNLDNIKEREYREACAVRLMEIVLDLENCFGVGRLFIP